jgi:copper homeostasis protein
MSAAVEIAVQDVAGLEVAAHGGADRVELCIDLDRGGVTPPPELVEACARRARDLVSGHDAKPHFDVHVLIRCRAGEGDFRTVPGEFVYTPDEVSLMASQAADTVSAGAAGVVIGALTTDDALDVPSIEQIRDGALGAATSAMRGVMLTCHRAVDALPDADARADAVTTLLGLGVHRILSSGGAAAAPDGTADLARMVQAADGLVDICAGGGIRPVHIPDLIRSTGITDVHLSARRRSPLLPGEDTPATTTDPAVVQAAVDAAGAS